MAAGLGYIEFATGDILTAAIANGYLASQTVMVFADSSARSTAITSPQEGMISYLKDTNAVEYYSGSAWTAVGAGGGGKVLQVVQGTLTGQATNSSSSFADTGLTVSITPSASTSKVLVLLNANGVGKDSANGSADFRILRGATTVYKFSDNTAFNNVNGANLGTGLSASYLDSPATTSSTTYKLQFAGVNGARALINVWANTNDCMSNITVLEIGA